MTFQALYAKAVSTTDDLHRACEATRWARRHRASKSEIQALYSREIAVAEELEAAQAALDDYWTNWSRNFAPVDPNTLDEIAAAWIAMSANFDALCGWTKRHRAQRQGLS